MIVAMLFAMTTIGQTVKFDVITDPVLPGTVEIGINFTDFTGVGGITLFIDYDLDLMQYTGPGDISLLGGTFLISESDGSNHALALAWSNYSGANFIDETIVLPFSFNGGFATDLVFLHTLPSKCEIVTIQGANINTTYLDSQLVPDLSNPDGTAVLGSATAIAGASVTIPVSILDAGGFNGVASSMSLFIAYDADKLVYSGVTDNSLGFNVSESDGVINLVKSTLTPLVFPLNDPVINLTFDYLGGGAAAVSWKSGSIVTDDEGNILITEFQDGEVTLDPNYIGQLSIAKVSSPEAQEITLPDPPGGTYFELVPVSVPITAGGFAGQDVGEISMLINFDSEKLTYDGYTANQFTGWTVSVNQEQGTLTFLLTSASALTVTSGDLITIDFLYLSGVAAITFDPGTFVKDIEADPIPTELVDGYVASYTNLDITVLLEGLYDGGGTMRKAQDHDGSNPIDKFAGTVADQITVRLHDKDDYNTIIWTKIEVDLNTDGTASLLVPSMYDGEYYLTILHRNHLETVSADPIDFSVSSISYDFTDGAAKAFGDNQKDLLDGKFAIFAGDVDGDGVLTGTGDRALINTDIYAGEEGYLNTDVDGDGIITSTGDRAITNVNIYNGVEKITP